MRLVVAKPFNTHLHRFAEGDEVREDANLAPHELPNLKKRKFIVADDKKSDKAD